MNGKNAWIIEKFGSSQLQVKHCEGFCAQYDDIIQYSKAKETNAYFTQYLLENVQSKRKEYVYMQTGYQINALNNRQANKNK